MSEEFILTRGETRLVNLTEVADDKWDVYIGRANQYYELSRSKFANPFRLSEFSRPAAIDLYKLWFYYRLRTDEEFRDAAEGLRGQTLACYCVPDACHGEVILQWLDRGEPSEQELDFIQARFPSGDLESEFPKAEDAIAAIEEFWYTSN